MLFIKKGGLLKLHFSVLLPKLTCNLFSILGIPVCKSHKTIPIIATKFLFYPFLGGLEMLFFNILFLDNLVIDCPYLQCCFI